MLREEQILEAARRVSTALRSSFPPRYRQDSFGDPGDPHSPCCLLALIRRELAKDGISIATVVDGDSKFYEPLSEVRRQQRFNLSAGWPARDGTLGTTFTWRFLAGDIPPHYGAICLDAWIDGKPGNPWAYALSAYRKENGIEDPPATAKEEEAPPLNGDSEPTH